MGDYFSEVLKFWIYRGFRGFRGSFKDLFKHCRIKATFNSEVLKFYCFGQSVYVELLIKLLDFVLGTVDFT